MNHLEQQLRMELIEIFKALLVGVDGLIDVAGDQIMDDDGDRAFASQFER